MSSVIRGNNNFDSAWGNGQTWQDVSASRVLGTTYTNSTGAPITVSFNASGTTLATLAINGVTVQKAQAVALSWVPIVAIVPNGATYSITGGGGIAVWVELR